MIVRREPLSESLWVPAWEEVSFGALASLRLPEGDDPVPLHVLEGLHEGERMHAASLGGRRRIEWVGGRLALRHAAERCGISLDPVLVGRRGEPLLPPGVSASISHKRGLAAALLSLEGGATVGLDLEELGRERMAIADRILDEEERTSLERLPPEERWASLLLRFAVKEAIYKAIHPRVGRFVSFHEAVVEDGPPLRADLRLAGGEGPFSLEVEHFRREEHLWAMVRCKEDARWRK